MLQVSRTVVETVPVLQIAGALESWRPLFLEIQFD